MATNGLLPYLRRYIAWNAVDIDDYRRFPELPVKSSGTSFEFPQAEKPLKRERIVYKFRGKQIEAGWTRFLEDTGTTALIAIRNGELIYEGYYNGYNKDSINTSFSIAKSIISLLIGVALEEGLIGSVEDDIVKYLPEAPHQYAGIKITHLLNMCSGLSYSEGVFPWADDPLVYYGLDLRKRAFKATKVEEPGKYYHYNNYNILLLGLILERVTRRPVEVYLQDRIWKKIGAEADASWSADSYSSLFAKMESGFNARAIDFARLGYVCLNQGRLNGHEILPSGWLEDTFSPPPFAANHSKYQKVMVPPLCRWASSPQGYYHNLWWGYRIDEHHNDSFALGVKWQLMYVAPRKNTVIVRFGKKWGKIDWWPQVLKELVDDL